MIDCKKMFISVVQHYRYYHKVKKIRPKQLGEKLRIAFIISFPASWGSVASVYKEAVESGIETCVIAVTQGKDKYNVNSTYDYLQKINVQAVPFCSPDTNELFDLKAWDPDYVFYTRPYNSEYPIEYQSKTVCRYSTICFVPYGFLLKEGYLFNSVYSWSFVLGSKLNFVQSLSQKRMCEKKFMWQNLIKSNRFLFMGSPRFDNIIKDRKKKYNEKYVVAWMPRWEFKEKSHQVGQSTSNFLKYVEDFINYASMNSEIQIIIRPHPLMFHTIIQEEILTENQLSLLLARLGNVSNICIDEDPNYYDTIRESDLLIADLTSIIVEYFMTGKPIIYCGDFSDFNEDAIRIAKGLYIANNWNELEEAINRIRNDDYKREKRTEIAKYFIPDLQESSAKKIIKYLEANSGCIHVQ